MNKVLVIGNGFDLAIGTKTSYEDFFKSDFYKETREKVFKWIDMIEVEIKNGNILLNVDTNGFDFNCWDLLFCMESRYNKNFEIKANWCDIESVIHHSFTDDAENVFSWNSIFHLLRVHYNMVDRHPENCQTPQEIYLIPSASVKTQIMYYFLLNSKDRENFKGRAKFYEMLLEELKQFELEFGNYIDQQTRSDNYLKEARTWAINLLDTELHKENDYIQVDSFNYSDFSNGKLIIRHINGECTAPIFGIDLTEEEEQKFPEVCRFTKTARRVQQDSQNLNHNAELKITTIDSVVVFGHSLNRMDYDYFTYLFTILKFNTFDIDKMGTIEFAYRVYDNNKADEIRNYQASRIYDLLNYYEAYINKMNQHVLINMLRFSGKLKIREVV